MNTRTHIYAISAHSLRDSLNSPQQTTLIATSFSRPMKLLRSRTAEAGDGSARKRSSRWDLRPSGSKGSFSSERAKSPPSTVVAPIPIINRIPTAHDYRSDSDQSEGGGEARSRYDIEDYEDLDMDDMRDDHYVRPLSMMRSNSEESYLRAKWRSFDEFEREPPSVDIEDGRDWYPESFEEDGDSGPPLNDDDGFPLVAQDSEDRGFSYSYDYGSTKHSTRGNSRTRSGDVFIDDEIYVQPSESTTSTFNDSKIPLRDLGRRSLGARKSSSPKSNSGSRKSSRKSTTKQRKQRPTPIKIPSRTPESRSPNSRQVSTMGVASRGRPIAIHTAGTVPLRNKESSSEQKASSTEATTKPTETLSPVSQGETAKSRGSKSTIESGSMDGKTAAATNAPRGKGTKSQFRGLFRSKDESEPRKERLANRSPGRAFFRNANRGEASNKKDASATSAKEDTSDSVSRRRRFPTPLRRNTKPKDEDSTKTASRNLGKPPVDKKASNVKADTSVVALPFVNDDASKNSNGEVTQAVEVVNTGGTVGNKVAMSKRSIRGGGLLRAASESRLGSSLRSTRSRLDGSNRSNRSRLDGSSRSRSRSRSRLDGSNRSNRSRLEGSSRSNRSTLESSARSGHSLLGSSNPSGSRSTPEGEVETGTKKKGFKGLRARLGASGKSTAEKEPTESAVAASREVGGQDDAGNEEALQSKGADGSGNAIDNAENNAVDTEQDNPTNNKTKELVPNKNDDDWYVQASGACAPLKDCLASSVRGLDALVCHQNLDFLDNLISSPNPKADASEAGNNSEVMALALEKDLDFPATAVSRTSRSRGAVPIKQIEFPTPPLADDDASEDQTLLTPVDENSTSERTKKRNLFSRLSSKK